MSPKTMKAKRRSKKGCIMDDSDDDAMLEEAVAEARQSLDEQLAELVAVFESM